MDSQTPKHLLLVEDNLSLGAMMLSTLRNHHYQAAAVTGAEAALRILAKEVIDLIILDILLPEMNGLDFLAEIRRRGHDLPVIVVTNMGDPQVRERALALGATYYLVKANTTPETIVELVRTILAEAG